MKKLIFIFFVSISTLAKAQITIGPKANLGFSQIKSNALMKGFEAMQDSSADNSTFNNSVRAKGGFGLGAFIEYRAHDKFRIVAEPTFNISHGQILINSASESLDSTGTGISSRISSQAEVKACFISLPIMGRFIFGPVGRFYVTGGVATNIYFQPRIKSNELFANNRSRNGKIIESQSERIVVSGKAANFSTVQFNLVLGAGKNFGKFGKDLYIDLRYYHPVSKSALATSNPEFTEKTASNYVFSEEGSKAFSEVSAYKLNDFKMGMIMLSASYSIYKKK